MTEADVRTPAVTAVAEAEAPHVVRNLLAPSVPNPFSGATELVYALPEQGRVRIAVYDVAGREVAVLVDAPEAAGRHAVIWNGLGKGGTHLPAGAYFVQIEFGAQVESQKVVLVR